MNRETAQKNYRFLLPLLLLVAWPAVGWTQTVTPVIEEIEELTSFSSSEIEELVGPIALYPDDLLAIVLPAATYPLQIVEAARFLDALEADPELRPDDDWDDSVVALLNYPEVVELLNEDLDWTWRLGEAVVAQQSDVIAAIELFRDRAYDAGNLESDDYQLVSHEGGSIQITPVEDDVIYVPYYEPQEVVVYQPRRVYYYYPRPYPVYYYPYPSYHVFHHGHFWGVTTAFSIGWHLHHLNVYHHSFYGHPYYGHRYWDYWWYRRPDIHIYNNYYVRNHRVNYNRYRDGDRWYPNVRSTIRHSDQRVTRTRYYPGRNSSGGGNTSFAPVRDQDRIARTRDTLRRDDDRSAISFRERPNAPSVNRSGTTRPSLDREPTRTAKTTRPPSRRPTVARDDSPRTTTTRPSTQLRPGATRPTSRPSTQPRPAQTRPSSEREPHFNATSRPSQPRTQAPRPSQPRTQAPRPSQPKVQASGSSQPKAQVSQPSKSTRPSQSRSGSRRRR